MVSCTGVSATKYYDNTGNISFNAATLIALKGKNNFNTWAKALKVELAS